MPKDFEFTIPSQLDQIEFVEQQAEKAANIMNFSEDEKDSLAIAVTEAVNNAIIHGNKKDAAKSVTVQFSFDDQTLTVGIQDEGGGFNPKQIKDPLAPENLLKESGRGVFILSSLMDEVKFDFSNKGTKVILTKTRK